MSNRARSSVAEGSKRLVTWGEQLAPPEPHAVGWGPLAAELVGPELAHLHFGATEILRSLEVVVRDRNWGTAPARVISMTSDGPAGTSLAVHHKNAEVDFSWEGRFSFSSDGLQAEFQGVALRAFLRNRIGWCLLHPLELAGTEVEITTVMGKIEHGIFPVGISPHQPFKDLRRLAYRFDGVAVELLLEGDVFETEDHRNWTDLGYKTYSTPLSLPFPTAMGEGDSVSQRVTVRAEGVVRKLRKAPAPIAACQEGAPLPMPALGLVHSGERRLGPRERPLIEETRPSYFHLEVCLDDPTWETAFRLALADAEGIGVPLVVAVSCSDAEDLLRVAARFSQGPVSDVLVFDVASHVTSPELAQVARKALAGAGARVGGGSRAHFAELNRAEHVPLPLLETVTYSVCAEMHSEGRSHVRETLLVQPVTVRQARQIAPGHRLLVGPVSFRPRFNAVATGKALTRSEGELPDNVDARQGSVFGAAWTLGAIAALGGAGADAITLYETIGWRGVVGDAVSGENPCFPGHVGEPFPVWHVLRLVAKAQGALLPVTFGTVGLVGLCRQSKAVAHLFVANIGDETAKVGVPGPLAKRTWQYLAADFDDERGWSLRECEAPDKEEITLAAPSVAVLPLQVNPNNGFP